MVRLVDVALRIILRDRFIPVATSKVKIPIQLKKKKSVTSRIPFSNFKG